MAKVNEGCRSAGIGCIECKSWAADALVNVLNPMQERRKKYEDNPRLAWDILEAGSARAREIADATMNEVRDSMGMSLEYEPRRDCEADEFGLQPAPAAGQRKLRSRRSSGLPAAQKPAPKTRATSRSPSRWEKSTKARSTCCST